MLVLIVLAVPWYNHLDYYSIHALSPQQQQQRPRLPIGRITTLDRTKIDIKSDTVFYKQPNMIVHTDETFVNKLTALYDEIICNARTQQEDGTKNDTTTTNTTNDNGLVILDIMASHVSHLSSQSYGRVDVHGMNENELQANTDRIRTNGKYYVRDFNANPTLVGIIDDDQYDLILCCVGVQYLEEPEQVFAELGRIIKPGGTVVVSFTNTFFYQKALTGWIERGMKERARLVCDYFRAAGGFEEDTLRIVGDGTNPMTQLFSLISSGRGGSDPFVAVVATRNNEP